MEQWTEIRAADFIEFNPRMSIKKGTIATKVAMDKLQPFTKKIPDSEKASFSGGSKFRNGDTIMARITPCLENGKTAFVDILGKDEVAFGSTEFIVMRAREGISDPQFIYYLATSAWFRNIAIKSMVGSSGRQRVQQSVLDDLVLNVPPLEEQKKISSFLCVLDLKIALNNEINDNLAAMAYDIYMHTFFSKKPNGRLKDILVETDKSSVQVGEAKQSTGEYPFFTSGSAILKWDTPFIDGRNCFLNTGGNADVKFYVGKAAYSTDTWCISATNDMADYLYLLLVSIKPELNQKFFQGTGLKHLQKPLLKDRPIYIPDFDGLKIFNKQVNPMFNIISENTRENQELITLRDWLLPMLMNGQATISD